MLRAIKRTIEQSEIRTISVDIFDTLLLRTLHPESARFYRIAQAWQRVLHKDVISATTLMEMRAEVTQALRAVDEDRGGDGEITINDIVESVIHLLESRYDLTLSDTRRQTLASALIEAELQTEEAMLIPNHTLKALLIDAKTRGMRLYFLSDMYLSGDHIRRLLRHCSCDGLFDDGVTSSDIGMNKGTGRAYERMILQQGFGTIDIRTHLHIGDHSYCDVLMPQRLGIRSIHYDPHTRRIGRHLVRMVRSVQRVTSRWARLRSVAQQYRRTMRQTHSTLSTAERIAYDIGTRLAPAVASYISFLGLYTEKTGETITFLSREGEAFSALLQKMKVDAPHIILSTINRHLVLCATLHEVLHTSSRTHDERLSRFVIDRFCDENIPSFLHSLSVTDEERDFIIRTLRFTQYTKKTNDHTIIIDALRRIYEKNEKMRSILSEKSSELIQVLQQHSIAGAKRMLIADIGWLGTMQYLLEIVFEKQGIDIDVHGLYLGTKVSENGADLAPRHARGVLFSPRHPALTGLILTECLWEYALETENQSAIQKALHAGVLAGIDFCVKHPSVPPPTLFRATLPSLIRFMNLPTPFEVRVMGAELFDLGLGMDERKPILSLAPEAPLRFRPRRTLRRTKDQLWQTGFLVQHQLYGALLLRFALRLLRAWRRR